MESLMQRLKKRTQEINEAAEANEYEQANPSEAFVSGETTQEKRKKKAQETEYFRRGEHGGRYEGVEE